MSLYATKWAYAQPVKPAGRKFVLVAIADFADAEGRAFPGVDTIATMTGQDERSVRRHIDALEKGGYLRSAERRRQDGSRTTDDLWLLAPADALRPPLPTTGQSARKSTGQNVRLPASTGRSVQASGQSVQATGQVDGTNRTICPPSPGNLSGHEPSVNHQFEPSVENTLAAAAAAHVPTEGADPNPEPQLAAPHRPAGQAEVEASARHSSATALEEVTPAAARARPTDFARIVAAWNTHRGALPEVRDVTEGRKKAVRRLLADCGGEVDRAVQVLAEATREVAQDGFWQERRYGFDNLVPGKVTQKAEAWRARQGQASNPTPPTAAPTLSTRIFQVGQRVSYKRDHYDVETVAETYIDLYDDRNGSARVLLSSSDWNAVRPASSRA